MKLILLWSLGWLILTGCSDTLVEESKSSVLYKGTYTFGFEVSEFSPGNDTKEHWLYADNDTKEYWLYADNQALDEIETLLIDKEKPYSSVYIEFYGENEGPSPLGGSFPAQYDAVIKVLKVIHPTSNSLKSTF